ncbi:hypothetical protein QAD02_010529 [Eretmocerus hayati]|uniref:Uncharacterized protein n=1 Tax=Eretmocerus hayati TaxID=131215 RepID=A0ACC2NV45_9HYME|nr:hypothetical protein QAD02_010529 [Eretmocerus hayati]
MSGEPPAKKHNARIDVVPYAPRLIRRASLCSLRTCGLKVNAAKCSIAAIEVRPHDKKTVVNSAVTLNIAGVQLPAFVDPVPFVVSGWHNKIVNFIAKKLVSQEYRVLMEPYSWMYDGPRKLDIVATLGRTSLMIDAQVVDKQMARDRDLRDKPAHYGRNRSLVEQVRTRALAD